MCTNELIVLHLLGIIYIRSIYFFPTPGFELTSQLQKVSRLPTEPPRRPACVIKTTLLVHATKLCPFARVRQIWKPQLCSLVYHRRLNCYCLDSSISSYVASRIESIQKTYATASEIGRNPVRKHQIQPEYGDEQADARRNCRTRLAIHYYLRRERAGQRKILFSLLS